MKPLILLAIVLTLGCSSSAPKDPAMRQDAGQTINNAPDMEPTAERVLVGNEGEDCAGDEQPECEDGVLYRCNPDDGGEFFVDPEPYIEALPCLAPLSCQTIPTGEVCGISEVPDEACDEWEATGCVDDDWMPFCAAGYVAGGEACLEGTSCRDGVCRPPEGDVDLSCDDLADRSMVCFGDYRWGCRGGTPQFWEDCKARDPDAVCYQYGSTAICTRSADPDPQCEELQESEAGICVDGEFAECVDGRLALPEPCNEGNSCSPFGCTNDFG